MKMWRVKALHGRTVRGRHGDVVDGGVMAASRRRLKLLEFQKGCKGVHIACFQHAGNFVVSSGFPVSSFLDRRGKNSVKMKSSREAKQQLRLRYPDSEIRGGDEFDIRVALRGVGQLVTLVSDS